MNPMMEQRRQRKKLADTAVAAVFAAAVAAEEFDPSTVEIDGTTT